MIAFFLTILEGMFNAVMDCVETSIAFKKSIFKEKNPAFWCKVVSAHFAKFLPGTKFRHDAWHDAKFFQIFSIYSLLVLLVFWPQIAVWPFNVNWLYLLQNFISSLAWYWQILSFFVIVGILGGLRNLSFNRFYNKTFRAK